MHKTMLAALIVAASALTIPAFAQVNLGGATQVGAGVNAGAAVPNAMHTVDQTGAQTMQTLHRADHKAKRMTHKAVDTTRATAKKSGSADVGVNANSSVSSGADSTNAGADTHAQGGASVDNVAATAFNQASRTGQSIGDQASDAAHSAVQTTGNTAGSVSNTVNQTATGQSVGADAKVNAKVATHGH